MDILLVVVAALVGSMLSLLGGLYLIYGGQKIDTIIRLAVPFAAGALLAAAFVDLLPEALHDGESQSVLIWALMGILTFFVLERGLRWFHHHHEHDNETSINSSLIIIGDTLHNFIDGLAIGAAFLVNPATGIIATVAVAAHEIPQEIGDFALLLSKGMRKKTVILVNILSAIATVIAAVFIYVLGSQIELPVAALLALTAGFFIYIAVSDIIPTIHAEKDSKAANIQTLVLLVAVVLVALSTTYAHAFLEAEEVHHEQESSEQEHHHEDEAGH